MRFVFEHGIIVLDTLSFVDYNVYLRRFFGLEVTDCVSTDLIVSSITCLLVEEAGLNICSYRHSTNKLQFSLTCEDLLLLATIFNG